VSYREIPIGRDRAQIEGPDLHLLGVAADQELVGAEVLDGLLALARGRADDGV